MHSLNDRVGNGLRTSIALLAVVASLTAACELNAAPPKSLAEAAARLSSQPLSNQDGEDLLKFFLGRYKQEDVSKGQHRHLLEKTDDGGGYAGWFFKAPSGATVIIQAEKQRSWLMIPLGESGYLARVERFPNFSSVHYRYEVDGHRLPAGRNSRFGFEDFPLGPDSLTQPGVPKGELIQMPRHTSQIVYPGAQRDWWIYVPAQYRADGPPAKLMVFNDGGGMCRGDGNAPVVFDNLIHQGRIPVTLGVFANPGEIPSSQKGRPAYSNRGNEYDTCTGQFASFLEKEILPQVFEKYHISRDPEDHIICGSSSGGSGAFTAAWHRPDLFRKVVSYVGSFSDFRGVDDYPSLEKNSLPVDKFGPWKTAHDYPGLIRRTEPPKPIKVFLQDGTNDLDNKLGNWFLNNERMAAALAYSGYDYKFVTGAGMHSSKHGKSLLPEILVWLWED